jgi:hypothetical protein
MNKRKKYAMHVCLLTEGLDAMKRKDQRDPKKVLKVLYECKRFSVFEATANPTIAKMMTELVQGGYIEVDNSPGYPWSNVKLTPKGQERLV